MILAPASALELATGGLSRRAFVLRSGAFVLGAALPTRVLADVAGAGEGAAAIAPAPGTRVAAFIEIGADNSVRFLSPFVEGGQGIATGMAQTVGEELDVDPARIAVECAPPGPDYMVVNGMRLTGGSFSTRSSFPIVRRLGATARDMLLRAAAARLEVDAGSLTTHDGTVVHAPSGRTLSYGDLANDAFELTPREDVALRDPATFRWIGKPVGRIDVADKSRGLAKYTIDLAVDGMLFAAVVHAPHYRTEPKSLANEADVKAMPGLHSVHTLPGAVAVTADSWWRARKAVEALDVTWTDPEPTGIATVAADFSSDGMLAALRGSTEAGVSVEAEGDTDAAFAAAATTIEAEYHAPYLNHAQLEPPSAIARFNEDGTLEVWLPNQMPEAFQKLCADAGGVEPDKVRIHSPILGGFFGRHFTYGTGNPFPQAIALAKATGRPVKLIWSREEEFRMDAMRPLSFTRLKAAIGADGMPTAITSRTVGEGPLGRYFGLTPDSSAVEGITEKPYAVPNRSMEYVKLPHPVNIAFWRSVGHSMNDFFYEGFLDEIAEAGGRDPFELRKALLAHSPRHLRLLDEVAKISGGWKRGPYEVDGAKRARGLAMASPFGSETATIAEGSLEDGSVKVHHVWVAFDPGSVVNPAIVKAQVESAVALGLSETLVEQAVYENGLRRDANYDTYQVLRREMMPQVTVSIALSGAPMGGVGEPGLPGVPGAVVNAVAALTGVRARSLPLANTQLSGA